MNCTTKTSILNSDFRESEEHTNPIVFHIISADTFIKSSQVSLPEHYVPKSSYVPHIYIIHILMYHLVYMYRSLNRHNMTSDVVA